MEIGKVEIIDYCFRCPMNKSKEKPMEFKPMENKVIKKCTDCGCEEFVEDKICECCGKEFKPMENKVIFESEEKFEIAFKFFMDVSFNDSYKIILNDARKKNLIRKSAVEEAEELDNKFDIYYSIPENRMDSDKQWIRDACELVIAYRGAIQEQKKEIERLKNG